MKKYTMKLVTCLMLLCFVTNMSAKEVYLSSLGNDGNDGSASDQAVSTLTKALSLVPTTGSDHVIKVSGIIDISKEISDNNGVLCNQKINFSIEGDSKETSGFSGENKTRAINFQGFSGEVVLENLTFKNGLSTEGGAIRALNSGGKITIYNCSFTDNVSTTTGTVHAYRSTLTITKCDFFSNNARFGGGVYIGTDAVVAIDACQIFNNDISVTNGSLGGGIYIKESNGVTINNSVIKNNKSRNQGGGIAILNTANANDNIFISNTLIAYNRTTGSSGGGLFLNNGDANKKMQVVIANSTIYGNGCDASGYGGAMFVTGAQPGSSIQLVNNTIVENTTAGGGGHGPAINFRDCGEMKREIYNCIIENNLSVSKETSAISANYNYTEDNFILRNSFVNTFSGSNNGYANGSLLNNVIGYGFAKSASLAAPSADYIASQNSIPLDFDSDGLKMGNSDYLRDILSINTDQLGVVRPFTDNACAVGSVEIPADLVIENPENKSYEHFIIYGQSLSVGHQSYYSLSVNNVPGNYMIGDEVWFNLGNTTFDKLNPLVAKKATRTDIGENSVISAVNHIRIKQEHDYPNVDNRFIATSTGVGGKTIEQLSKGSADNLYPTYQSALKSADGVVKRLGSTISCPAVFWMQGESNYGDNPTPKDEYKTALIQLKNDMQNDAISRYGQLVPPIFYTYQVGAQYVRKKEMAIGMAQLEASNENDDLICVGPIYPVSDVGAHLDGNGTRWFGEIIGKVYYKTKVLGEKFKPLQPKGLSRDASNSKKVIVKFHVPQLPLAFDTNTLKEVTDYGFEVYNDNARQTISNIAIDNDCVILTCTADLTGTIEVVYAGENARYKGTNQGRGHGNLRDSDTWTATSNYINPDLKDGDGNHVYPHYYFADGYNYTPDGGEPKGEDGNPIYDKPYPLYNFSMAFYYAIPAGQAKFEVPNMIDPPTSVESEKVDNNIQIKQIAKTLHVSTSDIDTMVVELTDISGKTVHKFKEEKSLSQSTVEYNISSLVSGIYVVNVWTPKGSKTQKIIL